MRQAWSFLQRERRSLLAVLSVLSTLVVTALLVPKRESLELAIVVLVYMLPVGVSTALGGFVPGINTQHLTYVRHGGRSSSSR